MASPITRPGCRMSLKDSLFPYQTEGAVWLTGRKIALLADEMGLGKSAQVVKAAENPSIQRLLILCPASLRANWSREFERFSEKVWDFQTIYTKRDPWPKDRSIVASYDLAPNAPEDVGAFDACVLDESHYLKSPTASRTKAVLGETGLIRRSKRVWALSGTPMPNHPGELWTLLFTFGQTKMSYEAFVERYCTGYRYNHQFRITGTRHEHITEIKNLLKPIMLRRQAMIVKKDLPPIIFRTVVVEPGPVDFGSDQMFIKYTIPVDRREEMFQRIKEEEAAVETVISRARETRLQCANAAQALEAMAPSVASLRRMLGLQKVKPVCEILREELRANPQEKIVVFAWHQTVIELLLNELKEFRPCAHYGPTNQLKKERNIDRFQNNPKYRVFIGNIQSAGTGLTLTAANQVVYVESSFSCSDMAQSLKRCHRIGQERTVFVRFFSVANSVDERITEVLKRKTRDMSLIFS